MGAKRFVLRAHVSTDSPEAVRPVLEQLVGDGSIHPGEKPGEFRVEAELEGATARDLNRFVLSQLRRVERKTRLRAEWTHEGWVERFFDYVPKGKKRA